MERQENYWEKHRGYGAEKLPDEGGENLVQERIGVDWRGDRGMAAEEVETWGSAWDRGFWGHRH